jgi:hypothetical protein
MNFFIILSLLFSMQVFAGIGTAIYIKGEVSIKGSNNKFIKLKKGQMINVGDMIRTKNKSIAVLSLKSGSKIKLNENSALTIEKERTKTRPSSLFLNAGSVFMSILKSKIYKTGKSKVKMVLKTRTTAMGVRGTKFFASYGKQKSPDKRKDLWMCVNSGLVEVKTNASKKTVLVKAGEGIEVKEGKEISDPKALAWTKNLNWEFDAKKGDLENKVSIEEAYTDLLDKDYD